MADLEGKAFFKRNGKLVPADLAAEDWLNSVPDGKEILISYRSPRNIGSHKHLFAILKVACEQLEGYPGPEELLDAVKVATHLTRPVKLASGEIIWIPKSINWAAMGQEEFARWKARALYVLGKLLGIDPQQLLEEVGAQNASNQTHDRPEPPAEAYEGDQT
jgi:hypothetical protein